MSEGACEVSIAFEGEVLVQTQMENEFTYESIMSELMKKYTFYSLMSDKLNFAIYDTIEPIIIKHNITAKK